MATFLIFGSWTEQGIKSVKDAPKRLAGARDLAKKLGIDFKIYLTTGESDLFAIAEAADPENILKFDIAIASMGAIRTRTVRAWPESEMMRLISELP
jgi:uncharacterized protein with GYD domain